MRIASCWLLLGLALGLTAAPAAPPKVMLWSWFSEDDFRFLTSKDIGVAYRALSLMFQGAHTVTPAPRSVPVWISPATYTMAVIRIDYQPYDGTKKTAFTEEQRHLAVAMILEIAELSKAVAIQIDFDAPESAHGFYRKLLSELRERLKPTVFLSMTALVSWCGSRDSWLHDLPVDEVVPMAFDMGQSSDAVRTMLKRGERFAAPVCQASIGLDARQGNVSSAWVQRRYFFLQGFPGGLKWTADVLRHVLP